MCAYRPVVPIFPSQSQGAGASSFPAFSTPSSLSLKRPFRHRRKDPSCDACRERKVKCDATANNSCTECRTRNVKCQFTKEHMRRITSIKQVQDLERKLRNAKLEVSNLQSQMQRQRLAALDDTEWTEQTFRRNSNDSDLREPLPTLDFRRVREEIIRRSPGLFNVPPAWREYIPDQVGDDVSCGKSLPPVLPPREFVHHLLQLFKFEVFALSPSIDVDALLERAEEMYTSTYPKDDGGIPLNTSRSWLVMFYATLANTAQLIQDDVILQYYTQKEYSGPIGGDFAESAAFFFGPVTKKNTLDDVRGALTLAVYYKQLNELGAANIWLGLAYKIAQYLGCHRYSPGLSRVEEEARANAWWDIYLFDRLLAGQQGCEMSIMDNDCDLPPPDITTINLQLETQDRVALHAKLYSWTLLHGRVIRLLRDSTFLSQEEIDKLDDRIQAQYDKMPRLVSYNVDSTNTAWYLDNHIFVHNTKLRVFRHNLTPNAPFTSRFAALRSCIELAKEASSQIAIKFKIDDDLPEEQLQVYNQRVIRIIYPEHCQYLYSCAMFLIAAKYWDYVLPFIHALRTIGTKLVINKCCLRYLWGVIIFTEGRESILQMAREADSEWPEPVEEVLALIAADMHQDPRSWELIWQKEESSRKPRTLDIPSSSEETTLLHNPTDFEIESDVKSISVKTNTVVSPRDSITSDIPASTGDTARPILSSRWSGEDETWEAMVSYIAAKCDEQRQMEDVELTHPGGGAVDLDESDVVAGSVTAEMGVDTDTIQRRMSIANLL